VRRSCWSSADICRNFSIYLEEAEAVDLQVMAVLNSAVMLKIQKLLVLLLSSGITFFDGLTYRIFQL
jgi:hypothetical protein